MVERNKMITANTYYCISYNITKLTIYRLTIHTLLNKDRDTLIEQSLTLIQQSGKANVL